MRIESTGTGPPASVLHIARERTPNRPLPQDDGLAQNGRTFERAGELMRGVLTVILAGGKGTRLEPLTRDRAKPAVPFGGLYRIVDFTLSNCINSGLRRVLVVTQFKSRSLDRHIRAGWSFLSNELESPSKSCRLSNGSTRRGTRGPRTPSTRTSTPGAREHSTTSSFCGRLHLQDGLRQHDRVAPAAECRRDDRLHPVPLVDVRQFGIMQAAEDDRVVSFLKPPGRGTDSGDSKYALGSMGFTSQARPCSASVPGRGPARQRPRLRQEHHPQMIEAGQRVFAYRFRDENRKAVPYWRDVGTLDAYFQATWTSSPSTRS